MLSAFRRISPGRRFALTSAILALGFALLGGYAFLHAGEWLVRQDGLQVSHAAVVLSGGLPDRALGAAAIYRAGYVKEIWLTQPLEPSAAMEELHLPYAGEEEYSRMVLIEKGVSPQNIHILKPKINNTADELEAVSNALGSQPDARVIIVTSKAHTRRVRAIWNRLSTRHGQILVRAAEEDYFDPEHWWRNSNDALTVVREYLGLLNAWAGLPLHHSS